MPAAAAVSSGGRESTGPDPPAPQLPSCLRPLAQHQLPFSMAFRAPSLGSARVESSPGSARRLGDFASVSSLLWASGSSSEHRE